MTMTIRHNHMNTGIVCNGTDMAVRIVGNTNDIKRGWTFTNFDTKGKRWGG